MVSGSTMTSGSNAYKFSILERRSFIRFSMVSTGQRPFKLTAAAHTSRGRRLDFLMWFIFEFFYITLIGLSDICGKFGRIMMRPCDATTPHLPSLDLARSVFVLYFGFVLQQFGVGGNFEFLQHVRHFQCCITTLNGNNPGVSPHFHTQAVSVPAKHIGTAVASGPGSDDYLFQVDLSPGISHQFTAHIETIS